MQEFNCLFLKTTAKSENDCRLEHCKNGATCIDWPFSFYGYSCVCTPQWMGVNCDQSEK